MNEKYPKLIWGAVALGIYFVLVGLLIFYFNSREEKKPVHYVKKDEHRIQVSISPAKSVQKKKVEKKKVTPPKITKPKPKPKPKPKVKTKPKKVEEKKVEKKAIKEKVVKKPPEKIVKKVVKKKDENITKPKAKKATDLFSEVKTPEKKNLIQVTDKPVKEKPKNNIIKVTENPLSASQRVSDSLKKQKSTDSGEVNAYFAKVQAMLEAWPAQSEFAGEQATVLLYIKPSGRFEFQVTSGSNVDEFNVGLLSFLKQLQSIGFGKHNAGRTYEFEAEFIAKE